MFLGASNGKNLDNGAVVNPIIRGSAMANYCLFAYDSDRYENRADRLFQATRSFNEGRFWPFKDRHVRDSWDQASLSSVMLFRLT